MSCSELHSAEIEELVLGELDAEHEAALRAHVVECAACREELAMVTAERALFTQRAEAIAAPPPELAFAVRERVRVHLRSSEREARQPRPVAVLRPMARVASGVVRLFRRGHVTAACAAALFAVAGFSRLGTGTTVVISAPSATAENEGAVDDHRLASTRTDESLECTEMTVRSAHLAPSTFSQSVRDDLGVTGGTSYAAYVGGLGSLPSLASLDDGVSCGAPTNRTCERASCEPSVTCSSLRQ